MDRFSQIIKNIQKKLRGRIKAYLLSFLFPILLTFIFLEVMEGQYFKLWFLLFVLSLIFNSFYYLLYQKEMIYLSNANSKVRFSVSIRLVLNYIFFMIMFGFYLYCLEIVCPGTFKIHTTEPRLEDFLFYSSGVFLMNSQIEFQFSSIFAYSVVFIEQVASFLSLIYVLSIFKRID
jgi:hypothetical protein